VKSNLFDNRIYMVFRFFEQLFKRAGGGGGCDKGHARNPAVYLWNVPRRGARGRTIAVCANITIAIAAWECACKIFPKDRWFLTWGGMVQYDSARDRQTKPRGIRT
jgi:hypothetical protein